MGLWIRVAIRCEGNPLSIGRPRGAEIAAATLRELTNAQARHIHDPHVRLAATRGNERNTLAVGREHRLIIVGRIVGELLQAGAINTHTEQISRAIAFRGEYQPLFVGRQ